MGEGGDRVEGSRVMDEVKREPEGKRKRSGRVGKGREMCSGK